MRKFLLALCSVLLVSQVASAHLIYRQPVADTDTTCDGGTCDIANTGTAAALAANPAAATAGFCITDISDKGVVEGDLDVWTEAENTSAAYGVGDLLADGTVPLTFDWDIGNFDLTLKSITGDGTIEGATITEGGVGVPNTGDKLSVFAATSSAELAGVLSDEDNTGACAADKVCMGGHTHVVPVRHAIAFEDPVATDDFFFGEVAATTTWTSIYCKTLVGTVTLDVTSGGTDIEGTDIVCDTDGQADAGITNATGTVGHEIKLAITSVASAPTYLMVILNGTVASQ